MIDNGPKQQIELSSIDQTDGTISNMFSGKLFNYTVRCGDCLVTVLLDGGAQGNFIDAKIVQKLGLRRQRLPRAVSVRHSNRTAIDIQYCVPEVQLYFQNNVVTACCIEVPELNYDVLLGQAWHKAANPKIDWAAHTVYVQNKMLESISALNECNLVTMKKCDIDAHANESCVDSTGHESCVDSMTKEIVVIDFDSAPRYINVLQEFADVFANDLPNRTALGSTVEHEIELEPGKAPPVRGLYRMSPSELQELKTLLNDLLDKDFIAQSASPFAAPVLFVSKKDGSRRLCTDFRALNEITVKNRYPLPRIEDLQDCLQRAKVFSKIDLTSGYWQIPIRREDQRKTAFRTRYGHYEWKVMPFGLCNAPATFQRMMNEIFRDMLDVCVVIYLDDILVFSESEDEHERHLRQVLQRLRQHRLVAKPKKCVFGRQRVEFLGYVIEDGKLSMEENKVKAIRDWPVPFTSLKDIRSFLGSASYYRRFIPNFARIAAPLSDALRKEQEFSWTEELESTVRKLKDAMTSAPVLLIADPNKKFVVKTDASNAALGAVLEQYDVEGHLHPVAYMSMKLRPEQRHYEVRDLELLAIVQALKTWRSYLYGQKVEVHTDHMALESILKRDMDPTLKSRTLRAIEYLQAFDLDIRRIPGTKNVIADALSRIISVEANAVSTAEPDVAFLQSIREKYVEDELFKNILERLQRGEQLRGRYALDDGILYYTRRGVQRVCIPRVNEILSILLHDCHDSLLGGHLGVDKTLAYAQRHFYWPKMEKDVREYVESCQLCQQCKSQNICPAGLLQPLPIPEKRWESMSMDIITHLPLSTNGYTSCVVFIDRLTKMAHFVPAKASLDSERLARLFVNHVFRLHGMPKSIVSDRDSRFMSRFWKAVFETLGTKLLYSSAYHPQTDGQTERTNRTLEQMLRMYVQRNPAEWDCYLAPIEFAYNNATQASTGYSPFYLMHGDHPRVPTALSDRTVSLDVNVESAETFVHFFQQLVSCAQRSIDRARAYQKKHADQHRRELTFNVGDRALLSTSHLEMNMPSAFRRRFIGPFEIIEKISDVAYRLDLPPHMHIHNVFHVSLLRPHHESPDRFMSVRDIIDLDEEEEDNTIAIQPEVEKFLARRERVLPNGGVAVEFLVRWCNSPTSDDSWEELRNLPICNRQLREFQRVMRS